MPRFLHTTAALALLAGAFAAAPAARAQQFNDAQRSEIGKIVHDYLINNPEVLREAFSELERRHKAEEAQQRETAIESVKKQIFDSKYQVVVGNPDGKVTLVEFFDYNCGYCKKALSDLSRLAKENPDLRIVLRDFPVLGQGSVEAAQVAMAVAKQIQGDKFWTFHQKLLGGRGQAGKEQALAAARESGVDMARLEKDMKSPDIHAGYGEVMQIADKLALTGTPSWVVGKEVIVGAVGYAELNNKIANYRKCGKTDCG
ncbi:MAG: DsbA family protein [Methylobacteriaceae bacterium]|nr:DsbA family protein [Methylobacteriaceae bacterium]